MTGPAVDSPSPWMSTLISGVRIFTFLSIVSVLISIAAAETFLGIAFLLWIPVGVEESRRQKRLAVFWPSYWWPIQLFVAASLISLFLSKDPLAGMTVVRKFPLYFLIFLVMRFFDWTWVKRTFFAVIFVGCAASFVGIGQFVKKWLHYRHTGNVFDNPFMLDRIHGFVGHWMTFSGQQVLVMSAVLAFLVLFPKQRTWLWILVTGIVATSITLSFTRSIWLATFVILGLVLIWFRSKIVLVIPAVIIVAVLLFPHAIYKRLASATQPPFAAGRLEMAIAGWHLWQQHPWFGVGPQRVEPEFIAYLHSQGEYHPPFYTGHLHDNFVQIAVERGIFALLAYLWLVVELIVRFWRGSRKTSNPVELRIACLAGLLGTSALFVAGFFEYNFVHSPVLILFLFFISAPYARIIGEPSVSRSGA
ncbi:MAG: O-antigen ligase family protein [Acidobacteriia bacterium]|nr:O-antigen ligase family protein [Terriglobia bacterium]